MITVTSSKNILGRVQTHNSCYQCLPLDKDPKSTHNNYSKSSSTNSRARLQITKNISTDQRTLKTSHRQKIHTESSTKSLKVTTKKNSQQSLTLNSSSSKIVNQHAQEPGFSVHALTRKNNTNFLSTIQPTKEVHPYSMPQSPRTQATSFETTRGEILTGQNIQNILNQKQKPSTLPTGLSVKNKVIISQNSSVKNSFITQKSIINNSFIDSQHQTHTISNISADPQHYIVVHPLPSKSHEANLEKTPIAVSGIAQRTSPNKLLQETTSSKARVSSLNHSHKLETKTQISYPNVYDEVVEKQSIPKLNLYSLNQTANVDALYQYLTINTLGLNSQALVSYASTPEASPMYSNRSRDRQSLTLSISQSIASNSLIQSRESSDMPDGISIQNERPYKIGFSPAHRMINNLREITTIVSHHDQNSQAPQSEQSVVVYRNAGAMPHPSSFYNHRRKLQDCYDEGNTDFQRPRQNTFDRLASSHATEKKIMTNRDILKGNNNTDIKQHILIQNNYRVGQDMEQVKKPLSNSRENSHILKIGQARSKTEEGCYFSEEHDEILSSQILNSNISGLRFPQRQSQSAPAFSITFSKGKIFESNQFMSKYLSQHRVSHSVFCVKQYSKSVNQKGSGFIHQLRREVKIHSNLQHPAISALYGVISDSSKYYLISEPHEKSLSQLLQIERRLEESKAVCLLRSIFQGVRYLHSLRIIHRDLRPQNISIHGQGCKISDFGLAINEAELTAALAIPREYLSPEVRSSASHTFKADSWALGVIAYQMVFGFVPMIDESEPRSCIGEQLRGNSLLASSLKLSQNYKQLLMGLLQINQAKRMTVEAGLSLLQLMKS